MEGAGCGVAMLLFVPKPKPDPLVCSGAWEGCPNEKGADTAGAACVVSVLFEPKLKAGPLLACDGCPDEKLGGADWEVFCPKTDGVEGWAVVCPKLIWLDVSPNEKDVLGGANVACCGWADGGCCDCANGFGAEKLLKTGPAADAPRAPSRPFAGFNLPDDVSGVIGLWRRSHQ
jgi:hypothetical protein